MPCPGLPCRLQHKYISTKGMDPKFLRNQVRRSNGHMRSTAAAQRSFVRQAALCQANQQQA
jgi:hypothetical protein